MSLFVLASKDGWVNIMYTGLDAVGIDQQVFIALFSPRQQQQQQQLADTKGRTTRADLTARRVSSCDGAFIECRPPQRLINTSSRYPTLGFSRVAIVNVTK